MLLLVTEDQKMGHFIKKEILLEAPRKEVWETYRDHLPKLASVMKQVDAIEVIERESTPQGIRLKNLWKISGGLPNSIKKVIPSRLLSYQDIAIWNQEKWTCDFVETPVDESGIYECKGQNTFVDLGKKTLLTISLELNIYPEKIPGIPKFLAKGLVGNVERLISREVARNLITTAKVVENHIKKQ